MRAAYTNKMAELGDILGEMAGLAGEAIDKATQALLTADLSLAEQVITDDDRIKELSTVAEERAFALLALQAPVAGDLRSVVSGIQMVADIDRMGALALHVAKITRRRHPASVLPAEVGGYFKEMGRIAVSIAEKAKDVLETRDPDLAAQLAVEDEAMDDLHRHLFTVLMDRHWQHGVAAAVDITLLSRFYERFADHAVEVGRRTIFLVTGHLPEEIDAADADSLTTY